MTKNDIKRIYFIFDIYRSSWDTFETKKKKKKEKKTSYVL